MEMNEDTTTKKPLTRKGVVVRKEILNDGIYEDGSDGSVSDDTYTLWIKGTDRKISQIPVERNDWVPSGYWGRWTYGTRDFASREHAINWAIEKYNRKHGLI